MYHSVLLTTLPHRRDDLLRHTLQAIHTAAAEDFEWQSVHEMWYVLENMVRKFHELAWNMSGPRICKWRCPFPVFQVFWWTNYNYDCAKLCWWLSWANVAGSSGLIVHGYSNPSISVNQVDLSHRKPVLGGAPRSGTPFLFSKWLLKNPLPPQRNNSWVLHMII